MSEPISDEQLTKMNEQLSDANRFLYQFLDWIYPCPPHDGGRVHFSFISALDKLAAMGLGIRIVRIDPKSWEPWMHGRDRK